MHFNLALAKKHCQAHYENKIAGGIPNRPADVEVGGHGGVTEGDRVPGKGARRTALAAIKRRPGRWRGGAAISPFSPHTPRPLPLCRSQRTVAQRPRQPSPRAGTSAAIRCAIPRTHRWAGAATPTQRNTTQALERARRASDMINISNSTAKTTPRGWPSARPGPATRPSGSAGPGRPRPPTGRGCRRRPRPQRADRHRAALAQLAGCPPGPAGRPALRDERHRGLLERLADHQDARRSRRSYRDPRFDLLADARNATAAAVPRSCRARPASTPAA